MMFMKRTAGCMNLTSVIEGRRMTSCMKMSDYFFKCWKPLNVLTGRRLLCGVWCVYVCACLCVCVGVHITDSCPSLLLTPSLSSSLSVALQPPSTFFIPLFFLSAGVRVAGWQPCRSPHYAVSEPAEIYRDDKSSLEGNNDHGLWCRRKREGALVWTLALPLITHRAASVTLPHTKWKLPSMSTAENTQICLPLYTFYSKSLSIFS